MSSGSYNDDSAQDSNYSETLLSQSLNEQEKASIVDKTSSVNARTKLKGTNTEFNEADKKNADKIFVGGIPLDITMVEFRVFL